MAKFLVVVKSQDVGNTNTALNVAQGLRRMGASDAKVIFLGPGVKAVDRSSESHTVVEKNRENMRSSGIEVMACEMAMKNFSVTSENLVGVDKIVKGAEVIVKYADEGYQIITF